MLPSVFLELITFMTAQTSPLINTKNPSGFTLPGITLDSRQVLQELLQANHDKL